VNEEFLFGCGTQDWQDPWGEGRDGIYGGHAYPILRAVNYGNERLLMMKNPWGRSEWNGPWSDGSSQWNAKSIEALGHIFGDDGIFWIRYEDMLRKYEVIWKTRLFNADWRVTQQWTSLNVPWAGEYQDTKFEVALEKPTSTVFVLSQLDDRYFRGLTGQYRFKLSFRVHRAGEEDYLLRTFGEYMGQRSVSAELDLEAGTYEVRLKISAYRDDDADKVEDVVKSNWLDRRNKLLQIGMSYDLAHAKAQLKPKPKDEPKPESKPAPTPVAITVTESPAADAAASKSKPKDGPSRTTAPAESSEPGLAKSSAGVYTNEQLQVQDGFGSEYGSDAGGDPDPAKPAEPPGADKAVAEEKEDAPWGAVCVVGLRVYCREADATIQIVRPEEEKEAAAEGKEGQGGEAAKLVRLDVDDPARDAAKGAAKEKETSKGEEGKEKTSDVVNGQGGEGEEAEENGGEQKEEIKEEVEEQKAD
jgi:Calpain family cysteine protease